MKIILKVLLCFLFSIVSVCPIFAATTNVYCGGGNGFDVGDVQYKPDGDCSTLMRTCCGNFKWSEWNSSCEGPDTCSPAYYECWTGSKCEGPLNLGRCPKLENEATWVDGKCIEGKGWQYTCKCNNTGKTITYGNNDNPQCPGYTCSSGSTSVSVTSYSINLDYSNKSSLCYGNWGNYNNMKSNCQTLAQQWFNSSQKCYTGFTKRSGGDYCVSSLSGTDLYPADVSDFNYRFDQLCNYGRSSGSVTVYCRVYFSTTCF